MADELPSCGIYRTGRALRGHEEHVLAGTLVYFHNHSDQGSPLVLAPETNTDNRWSFRERGWLVDDIPFIHELIALKPQGFYTLTRHLHVSREEVLPERSLVQLGYNRRGDTILFAARFEGLTISFPAQGYRFEAPALQQHLEPVNFAVPRLKADRTLH